MRGGQRGVRAGEEREESGEQKDRIIRMNGTEGAGGSGRRSDMSDGRKAARTQKLSLPLRQRSGFRRGWVCLII